MNTITAKLNDSTIKETPPTQPLTNKPPQQLIEDQSKEDETLNGFAEHVNKTLLREIIKPETKSKKTPTSENYLNEISAHIKHGRYNEVKYLLRKTTWSLNSAVRRQLWPMLCAQHQVKRTEISGFYWSMVEHIFGSVDFTDTPILLPSFVDLVECIPYYLSQTGRSIADRIVNVLVYDYPAITYSPALYPVIALLLHFLSEEQTYHCITALLGSRDKFFINQTKQSYDITGQTLLQITRRQSKHVIAYFQRICPDIKLECVFRDWCWWILLGLPFPHVVRIMDCYLHEGIKVFYRVVIAILNLFENKWTACQDLNEDCIRHDISNAIFIFCKRIPVTPSCLIRFSFNIWGLSSTYINKIYTKSLKNMLNNLKFQQSSIAQYTNNSHQQPFNILTMPHSLIIRDHVHTQTWQRMLFMLWSWLPGNIGMQQPVTIYSTQNNERSLNAFYKYLGQHEPTLIMIESCNNEIFGAYCSSRWLECKDKDGRRYIYFGTGESFLFTLYPKRAKYAWIDIENYRNLNYSTTNQLMNEKIQSTDEGDEGKAIWLDDNLVFGKTSCSKSFNSPPLCPTGEFEIRLLQLFGFIDPNVATHKFTGPVAFA